jgi:hypothetical protein
MTERMQYCFNCGEELGVYKRYRDEPPECCGRRECQRELRDVMDLDYQTRREAGEVDEYRRY